MTHCRILRFSSQHIFPHKQLKDYIKAVENLNFSRGINFLPQRSARLFVLKDPIHGEIITILMCMKLFCVHQKLIVSFFCISSVLKGLACTSLKLKQEEEPGLLINVRGELLCGYSLQIIHIFFFFFFFIFLSAKRQSDVVLNLVLKKSQGCVY